MRLESAWMGIHGGFVIGRHKGRLGHEREGCHPQKMNVLRVNSLINRVDCDDALEPSTKIPDNGGLWSRSDDTTYLLAICLGQFVGIWIFVHVGFKVIRRSRLCNS
jgi:hypothetical protein